MKNIESIIFGDLRPFKQDFKGDDYYAPELRKIQLVAPKYQPCYNINFPAPLLSPKTKYYKRLIDNDITTKLNELFNLLDGTSVNLIFFHRKKLFETMKFYLESVQKYIDLNQLDLNAIISQQSDFSVNFQLKECTYIFNYMLTALICYYIEFQAHYIQFINEDRLFFISDFYTQILKRQTPENTFIKENPEINQIEEIPPVKSEKKKKSLTDSLSFLYVHLDSNPEAITDLFNSLKDVAGLIDSRTRLVDFKKVFSGKEVVNPIVWTGTSSELYYFIKYIHNIQKSVIDTRKQQWKIACNCFVGTNDSHFDKAKLKALKDPNPQSVENIKKAANNLTV